MPDILQTTDHYKHSRKWTLTGRWGEECIACLVFLLDGPRTPITKKKSLLSEINHLLRTSDELKVMLSDCDLSRSLGKIITSTLVQTQDEIGIESVLLLEQHIPCTVHPHSVSILEEVSRKFYEHSNNHKVAGLLARALSGLISANLELRNEVIRNKLVDNMCDSLRPSNEQIQNIILTFLLHLHSYSPLHQVVSELRLVKLIHNTIKLLSSTITVAKGMYLIHSLLSNETFANKHKASIINQGKLMGGIKHALAYTKTSDVIASALSLLKLLDAPQLITQHNLLDYILECLSSEDESVCMSALDLCITSQHKNKSSVMYISDSLIALIDREKKRMRGDIIERSLIFLLKLSEIRVPENFHSILLSVIEWGNETLVSLICLVINKFKVKYSPVQAMKMLVELLKWLNSNLSQRTRKLPSHSWLPNTTGHCREGEQVLPVVLSGVEYLISGLLDGLDNLDQSVLRDVVIICDEHCIPPVFSLDTSELCPHVYKHLFSIVTRVLKSCHRVSGHVIVEGGSQSFASKFTAKIFGVSRDSFILRSTLCSAFKHPDVLSVLHEFIATTTSIFMSDIVPLNSSSAFHQTLLSGLDVLPYRDLEEALSDSLRSAERPSYHADLARQSSFCANVTCLALVLVKSSLTNSTTSETSNKAAARSEPNQTLGCSLIQIVNLYGTHRLLPSFFLSLVIKLFSVLRCQQFQGLKLSLDTQQHLGNVHYETFDQEMLKFVLSLDGVNEGTQMKCAARLVKYMKEGSEGGRCDIDTKTGMKVLKILCDDGKISENLNVIQGLIGNCTDKKIVDAIVAELNSAVMLDVLRYNDTLTILTSIATCHNVQSASTRTLLAVLQCVICDSGNLGVSLQYLYVQYVVNTSQMSDLMVNRYDVIACLCSQIKFSSPHLDAALLLLLVHLAHKPDCEGVVVEVGNLVDIIEKGTSPLTLTLLWKLLQYNIAPQCSAGLKYLALRSLVEPNHNTSVSAAVFIRSFDNSALPWLNTAIQTTILLDNIPSGVIWLLVHLDNKQLRCTVQHRIKHLLTCLKQQFHSDQQTVIMKLFIRLFELFPESATDTISKCVPNNVEDIPQWHRQGVITFHQSSVTVIGSTRAAEISKEYKRILDYLQSKT